MDSAEVKIGSVYADQDPRRSGRRITVVDIVVLGRDHIAFAVCHSNGNPNVRIKIRLDRLRRHSLKRGYRLLSSPDPSDLGGAPAIAPPVLPSPAG